LTSDVSYPRPGPGGLATDYPLWPGLIFPGLWPEPGPWSSGDASLKVTGALWTWAPGPWLKLRECVQLIPGTRAGPWPWSLNLLRVTWAGGRELLPGGRELLPGGQALWPRYQVRIFSPAIHGTRATGRGARYFALDWARGSWALGRGT